MCPLPSYFDLLFKAIAAISIVKCLPFIQSFVDDHQPIGLGITNWLY